MLAAGPEIDIAFVRRAQQRRLRQVDRLVRAFAHAAQRILDRARCHDTAAVMIRSLA
ncbi:MAG: hypothetical protein HC869_15365 [Rhodospirillales bacterium]|nr:hypothetical protein [Rhodospirillales bacterium]